MVKRTGSSCEFEKGAGCDFGVGWEVGVAVRNLWVTPCVLLQFHIFIPRLTIVAEYFGFMLDVCLSVRPYFVSG